MWQTITNHMSHTPLTNTYIFNKKLNRLSNTSYYLIVCDNLQQHCMLRCGSVEIFLMCALVSIEQSIHDKKPFLTMKYSKYIIKDIVQHCLQENNKTLHITKGKWAITFGKYFLLLFSNIFSNLLFFVLLKAVLRVPILFKRPFFKGEYRETIDL